MTANVRCAGDGFGTGYIRPCGWRGERFGTGDADLWNDDFDIRDAEIIRARTATPCPRCGGRVELIPQEWQP